jgi:hypothetical protein
MTFDDPSKGPICARDLRAYNEERATMILSECVNCGVTIRKLTLGKAVVWQDYDEVTTCEDGRPHQPKPVTSNVQSDSIKTLAIRLDATIQDIRDGKSVDYLAEMEDISGQLHRTADALMFLRNEVRDS